MAYFKVRGTDLINLTATMDDGLFTVSGHPDDLTSFLDTMPDGVVFHETKITALYHCPSNLQQVRDEVCADVVARKINFPTFLDLVAPIRSTFTGDIISEITEPSGSLMKQIIDMVLIQPINWDLVVNQMVAKLTPGVQANLLDVGLGAGLIRVIEKAIAPCSIGRLEILDLSFGGRLLKCVAKQEPIAIVGMSINMPGAMNVEKLWEMLVNGVNTIAEVSLLSMVILVLIIY